MQAAQLKNQNKKVTKESAMAKFYSSESCVEISSEAVQILGGYGYTKDFPAEKFYRDSKLCTIEGTAKFKNKSLVIYYLNNNTIFAGVKLIKC